MTTKRLTLRELRDKIHSGEINGRIDIIYAIDGLHDRLRNETMVALNEALRETAQGQPSLVVTYDVAWKKLRAVFDRRKRR